MGNSRGKIENRENPIKTAQREVKEELDVSVKIVNELGKQEFTEEWEKKLK